jgi:hypothetical protein
VVDEVTAGARQTRPRSAGDERNLSSICEDDCTPTLEDIARRIDAASASCMARGTWNFGRPPPPGELGSHPRAPRL